nr:Multiple coagulation factor deficiency protein [Haemonchus contortus]
MASEISHAQVFNFGDDKAIHDEAHMKEHLKGKIEVNAPMTEAQKLFHYFSMNDLNHDNQLDGIEILKSMTHSHDGHLTKVLSDDEVEKVVDLSMDHMDLDRDGFISFAEYKKITEPK